MEAVVSAQKSRRALAYGGRAGVDCDRTPVVTPIWVGVVSERPMNDSSSTPKMLSQLMALGPAVSVRVFRDIRRLWYPNHDCNLRAVTTVSYGARPCPEVLTLGLYQGWPRPCELLTALWVL